MEYQWFSNYFVAISSFLKIRQRRTSGRRRRKSSAGFRRTLYEIHFLLGLKKCQVTRLNRRACGITKSRPRGVCASMPNSQSTFLPKSSWKTAMRAKLNIKNNLTSRQDNRQSFQHIMLLHGNFGKRNFRLTKQFPLFFGPFTRPTWVFATLFSRPEIEKSL